MLDVPSSAPDHVWTEVTEDLRKYVRNHLKEGNRPETLKGIAFDQPPKDIDWFPVYDDFEVKAKPGEDVEWVDCAFCRTRDKFKHGTVFWFADGKLRLCGWRCAEVHFGVAVARDKKKAYRADQARRGYLEQIAAATPFLSAARNEAGMLYHSREAVQAIQFRAALTNTLNDLYQQLLLAIYNYGGTLLVLEEQSDTFQEAGGGSGRMGKYRSVQIGRILGTKGIRPDAQPRIFAEQSKKALSSALDVMGERQPEDQKTQALKKAIADMERGADRALEALERISGIMEFCQQPCLTDICVWANDPRLTALTGSYTRVPRGIRWAPSNGEPIIVQLAEGLALPELANINALKIALRKA